MLTAGCRGLSRSTRAANVRQRSPGGRGGLRSAISSRTSASRNPAARARSTRPDAGEHSLRVAAPPSTPRAASRGDPPVPSDERHRMAAPARPRQWAEPRSANEDRWCGLPCASRTCRQFARGDGARVIGRHLDRRHPGVSDERPRRPRAALPPCADEIGKRVDDIVDRRRAGRETGPGGREGARRGHRDLVHRLSPRLSLHPDADHGRGWLADAASRRGDIGARSLLHFLGTPFLFGFSSMPVLGAGRDAAHVVARIAERAAGEGGPIRRSRSG